MASLTHTNNRALIQFRDPADRFKRVSLSVSGVNRRTAEQIRGHVDHLVNALQSGQAVPRQESGYPSVSREFLQNRHLALHGLLYDRRMVARRRGLARAFARAMRNAVAAGGAK